MTSPPPILTRSFLLLCAAQFFGSSQHALLQPTFPLYITSLGGTPFDVGIVLACFAVTSVTFRPIIGTWADRWSEPGVLICGLSLLSAAVSFCFFPYPATTMFANALRGIGWAGLSAAGYTLLAISAPPTRRGEAAGYYSGVQASGTVLLPALALWLIDAPFGGFSMVFFVAIGLAATGAGCGALLARRTPKKPKERHTAQGEGWWRDMVNIMEREVILASVLSFASHVTFQAVASFLVLYAREVGISNIGWFYVASGTTSVLSRPLLGRVSDRIGRRYALIAGFAFQSVALVILAFATSLAIFIGAGVLYMIGLAMESATTLAIAVEKAKPEKRGKVLGTFSIALPLSNGVGALLCGSLVQWSGFFGMYLAVAGIAGAGLAVSILNRKSLK